MKRLTILILTLFIICQQTDAQTVRQYLTSANKWTEITSKEDLAAKIESKGYFFAIASATQDYTIGLANGVRQWLNGRPAESTLWYKSATDPLTDLSTLFYIEMSNDVEGTFCLRNVEKSEYLLQTSNDNPWEMYLYDQATPVTWTNIDFNFIGETSVFNMTWTRFNNRPDRFFGAWEDAFDANNLTEASVELAGNKPEAKKGNMVVYAIKRNDYLRQYIGEEKDVPLTPFIINHSFESNGWNGRGRLFGWTVDGTWHFMDNNALTTEMGRDGLYYVQDYNGGGHIVPSTIEQTIYDLPEGVYRVTVLAGGQAHMNLYAKNGDRTISETGLFYDENKTDRSITFEVKEGEPDDITIGYYHNDQGSKRWVALDNFRLTYVDKAYVGTATADAYIQTGKAVNVVYPDRFTPFNAEQLVVGTAKPSINGIELTPVATESGFTVIIPEEAGLEANTDYTISIPEGVVGYASSASYNMAQDIELRTVAVADGTYYLATESFGGEKLLLSRGNRYGTEAVVDKYGLAVEVRTNGNNETTFHFLDNNLYLFRANVNDVYTDNNHDHTWVVSPTETDGVFAISVPGGNILHAVNENYGNRLNTGNKGTQLVWNFISKEERNALVSNYPTANKQNVADKAGADDLDTFIGSRTAIDCSDRILNRTSGAQGAWQWHSVNRNPQNFIWTEAATVFEWYHGAGYATQRIEGLKSGVYRLTVDAIDRMFSVNKEVELRTAGYTENITFVRANGEQVRVKTWYDVHVECGTTDPGYPYWRDQSRQTMDNGFAGNELYVYVDEDGILDIEVNKPSWIDQAGAPEGSNFVFNNFTLTYYGRELTLADNAAMDYDAEPEYDIVHLTRTLKTGYNTFAVPFDIDAATIAEKFGEGTKVYIMDHASDENVGFMMVDDITANIPYIIYIQDNVVNPTFYDLTLTEAHSETVETGNWIMLSNFTPNFSYATLRAEEGVEPYVLVNNNDGTRIMKAGANAKTNGMRAYFIYNGTANTQNLAPRCVFGWDDDNTTGLDVTTASGKTTYYSTSGLKVSAPRHGIYIVKSDGKVRKVMVE